MAIKWDDIKRDTGEVGRGRREAVKQALEDAMALADLREARKTTQVVLAEAIGVSQTRVSRIEREDDLYISTLRRYVQALGGQLELRAVFDDDEVLLKS